MIQFYKIEKTQRFFWFLFLIFIPFGTRKLLHQFTPGFHEYEALFVYLSDIFLVLIFLLIYYCEDCRPEFFEEFSKSLYRPILVFILASLVSIFFAVSSGLAIISLLKLLMLIGLAVALACFARDKAIFKKILVCIAILAVLQSVIGIYQFSAQGPVGLKILGESPVDPLDHSTSKVEVGGGRLIRAYGTFPHPNILGAFLLLGLFSLYYLFLKNDHSLYGIYDPDKKPSDNFELFIVSRYLYFRLLMAAGIFVVLLGLAFSLSRTAWLITIFFTIPFLVGASFRHPRPAFRLGAVLVVCAIILYIIAFPMVSTRARITATEPAVTYRLSYDEIGAKALVKHPLGVGIGNQVLASIQNGDYRAAGMYKSWEWEPVHNIYLLIGAETGWLGILSFLAFLAMVVWAVFKNGLDSEKIISICLLFALLAFGLFDHFLWTLQPGRLMLWLAIGLVLSRLPEKNPT